MMHHNRPNVRCGTYAKVLEEVRYMLLASKLAPTLDPSMLLYSHLTFPRGTFGLQIHGGRKGQESPRVR
jgi:hypothetical protein